MVRLCCRTMTSGFWVVARTKAQREHWAAENVARQGFEFYLPLTASTRPRRLSKASPKPECLFPRYLFVWTLGPWRSLLSTFGVTGLVMQGERPAILPEKAVEQLLGRTGPDGTVQLPKASLERFAPGDEVRVNAGTFSGMRGVYQHHDQGDRARILLDFLGRKTRVLVGEDHLEPIS